MMAKKKTNSHLGLERDELERELIRKDRMTVITETLKIWDNNVMLQNIIVNRNNRVKELEALDRENRMEIAALKSRTWWQVLNKVIERKIQKKKDFNAQYRQANETLKKHHRNEDNSAH